MPSTVSPRSAAATDIAALRRVFWIAGPPDSGKSTAAQQLAVRFQLQTYHYDRQDVAQHERLAEGDPRWQRFLSASLDEAWVEPSPEDLVQRSLESFAARFPLVLDDLRRLGQDATPVIAEGFGLLPPLVAPLLSSADQAVCLTCSDAFKVASMQRRGKPSFAARTSAPERARENLLGRDRLLAELIVNEARGAGFVIHEVDGALSAEGVCDLLEPQVRRFLAQLNP